MNSIRSSAPFSCFERGFSLPELMVSLAIGTVIMLAVSILFATSHRAQSEIRKSSEQLENAFLGIQALQTEFRLAGAYGDLWVTGITLPTAPSICATAAADLEANVPIHIQGINDATSGTEPTCIDETIVDNTDIVAIRRAGTCIAGAANCEDPLDAALAYIQVSRCSTYPTPTPVPAYRVRTANTNGDFTLRQHCASDTDPSTATVAPLRRMKTHIFYVAANSSGSDGIPTLKRAELNGTTWTVTTVAEGVENLQVFYGRDTSGDGAPDIYESLPASITDWSNVTQVKVYVLARNREPTTGYSNSKKFVLGVDPDVDFVGPFNDGYKRQVLASEIRLVNPAGRRE